MTLSLTSRVTMIHISKLDLGKLTGEDDENKQAQFLKTFGDHCPKIVYLRLGKACINTENDSHVKYFCETIKDQLKSLKSLNLSGLDLNDDEACKIIMACEQRSENCQINYINLSDNELACLDFVIPEDLPKLKMNLRVLNLSKNNLGFAGDPFAKESDALYDTIQTLNTIMLEFPILSTLKMNNCNLGKYEGIAIAKNLVNCTLTKLDLGNNNCLVDKSVKEKLLGAWKGPTKGLIC
jgi:Ran GTPase-activating protein (RanGAP) involved in mRNA processing and transport